MSELNELIASSSVHAFNSGLDKGRQLERDRIIDILERLTEQLEATDHAPTRHLLTGIVDIIQGEQK